MESKQELTAIPKNSHDRRNRYDLLWDNKLAMLRVYETLEYYKVKPKSVDLSRGGEVVFRDIGQWKRIVIRDVDPIHLKPKPHVDCIHLAYSFCLSQEKVSQLHKISGSITYNSVGKMLYSGCDFVAASIGTFVIVVLFSRGDMKIDEASKMYDRVIIELYEEFHKSICFLDQSNSLAPIRDSYEKFLKANTTFGELKKELPPGSALNSHPLRKVGRRR